MESKYQFASVVQGHHISKLFWTPAIDEMLSVITEIGNSPDLFGVVLSIPEIGFVGHIQVLLHMRFTRSIKDRMKGEPHCTNYNLIVQRVSPHVVYKYHFCVYAR